MDLFDARATGLGISIMGLEVRGTGLGMMNGGTRRQSDHWSGNIRRATKPQRTLFDYIRRGGFRREMYRSKVHMRRYALAIVMCAAVYVVLISGF